MDIKEYTTGARTDLHPSPMPAAWTGTLTVSVVGVMEGVVMWGIKSNNAPISPRWRSADREHVEAVAREAIIGWIAAN